ncbi:ferritin [Corynebacterium sp. HMSC071B10]|uniref:ferritin n=1 Tax=Corynebacterium sp. HMSC071B10 TaxID=1739494 RepID=UPI0008A5E21E|nr:ferritin [Corynebacterium sp. HMSC071B10]OFP37190.1 ferritin [Corynebacterium sp. HMSC071B10]
MDTKLRDVMNNQVTDEYLAAYLYRHLANEMDALSFPGMSAWFAEQAREECDHAMKFTQHLLDRGERVELKSIEIEAPRISSPVEAFKAALEHEKKVSESIRQLTRVADEVGDLESRSLLTWFLDEQISEESSVSEIIDQLELVGTDGSGILRIDATLGARDSSN